MSDDPIQFNDITTTIRMLFEAGKELTAAIDEGEAAARKIEECRDRVNALQDATNKAMEILKSNASRLTTWGQMVKPSYPAGRQGLPPNNEHWVRG